MSFLTSKHHRCTQESTEGPQPRLDLEAPPKDVALTEDDDTEEDSVCFRSTLSVHPPRYTRKQGLVIQLVMVLVAFLCIWPFRGGLFPFHEDEFRPDKATLPSHVTLPSGDNIPSVALGVWRAEKGKVGEAVKAALKTGYRHIVGAWAYANEAEVGQALKESGVPRKDIWLTSKLWNTFHSPQDIEPALDESLSSLGTDYLDLYLMHWPVAFKKGVDNIEIDWELTNDPYPTWKKLEELVEKGKIRNIGLSNFNIRRIQNLTANPLKIKPAINQVELSYWNPQPELVKWSKENGILLEAYSPLGSAERVKESLNIPEVKKVAGDLGITPAQAYISWHVQRGTVVLPKSVTPSRVEENFHVTRLPQHLFDLLEHASASHKPQRSVDPSERWGVDIWN